MNTTKQSPDSKQVLALLERLKGHPGRFAVLPLIFARAGKPFGLSGEDIEEIENMLQIETEIGS